jgi:hypothetical protein
LFAQSVFVQQLPGTQLLEQQKSPLFCPQATLFVAHALLTHLPWLAPADVLQMVVVP